MIDPNNNKIIQVNNTMTHYKNYKSNIEKLFTKGKHLIGITGTMVKQQKEILKSM